jgi:hypothetical protein
LPARLLEAGMSTQDGQDIVQVTAGGQLVFVSVYTPRPDVLDQDERNLCEPETRLCQADDWVGLAVFEDTDVDGSDYAEAELADR